jgi:hypothetical protein
VAPVRALVVVFLAAAAAAVHVPSSSPSPPGYRTIFAGNPPTGGHWDLSAKRRTIAGRRALCLSFTTRSREGVEFSNTGCAAGTLRAWNNVFPIASGYGGSLDANLVGGFTVARARLARITFADGQQVTTVTRLGPPAFRRALGGPIRFIVVNAFRRTRAAARSVSVFDVRGRRIGSVRLGS